MQSDAIDRQPGERCADRVGDRERRDDPAVLGVRQSQLGAQHGGDGGERLTVEIVNGGRQNEDGENEPAAGRRHSGNSMVATSPAVPSFESGFGKYSTEIFLGFCRPQPRPCSLAPTIAICEASRTTSRTILPSSARMMSRACLPRQSTCCSMPAALPPACGPVHHCSTLPPVLPPWLTRASRSRSLAISASFNFFSSRASSSAARFFSASSKS